MKLSRELYHRDSILHYFIFLLQYCNEYYDIITERIPSANTSNTIYFLCNIYTIKLKACNIA